jgi:site-specific recombinase XerD
MFFLIITNKSKFMKPTDFSKYISDFLSKYLPGEKGASRNTISSYRDTFVLFLNFMENENRIKTEKIKLQDITKDTVVNFLDWIQKSRKCSNTTRNIRLAAFHTFYKYLQYENIEYLHECQRILSVKFKKSDKKSMSYLTIDGLKLLLQQPDITSVKGRKDIALLSLMYDAGARVQEVIDLTPSMLRLSNPPSIMLKGKGNKIRIVPMLNAQVKHLTTYMKENQLDKPHANMYPLFSNSRGEKLTRAGINHIIRKYANMGRAYDKSLIPNNITCHSLRHSKAMHLLQAGVNLVYIRDILGHVSVQTTEVYARADSKQKREALEKAYVAITPNEEASWVNNVGLLEWLKKF